MSDAEVAEHLRRAADLIRHEGHTKGVYHDDSGYCLVGAVHATIVHTCDVPLVSPSRNCDCVSAFRPVWRAVGVAFGGFEAPTRMVQWNDLAETTGQDVIDLLMNAAKQIENGETS